MLLTWESEILTSQQKLRRFVHSPLGTEGRPRPWVSASQGLSDEIYAPKPLDPKKKKPTCCRRFAAPWSGRVGGVVVKLLGPHFL